MFTEADETIYRLQHEKNVWRGIAIGLAAVLVLLLAVGVFGGLLLATSSQRAMRAEADARMQAEEVRRAAEQKGLRP
jgi:hypothetical protein